MESFLGNSEAVWSFAVLIASVVFVIAAFLWMRFCYYPGGYKRNEVMDMGEYAMIMHAQGKLKPKEFKYDDEDNMDELYYEMSPRTDNNDGRGGADWQSMGTSEHDVEGGEYYDGTTSPSTRSMSEAGGRHYDNGRGSTPSSSHSPAGYADAPSTMRSSQTASTRFRDDVSDTTQSTPHSARTHDTYQTYQTYQ